MNAANVATMNASEVMVLAQWCACICAALGGMALATFIRTQREARRRHMLHAQASRNSFGRSFAEGLECGGIYAWALAYGRRCSIEASLSCAEEGTRAKARFSERALKAGMADRLIYEGVQVARRRMMLAGGVLGALIGAVCSVQLAVMLLVAGASAGWFLLPRALQKEVEARGAQLTPQLGEMCEVTALGLRSGLSFDCAFALYGDHFNTGLASECAHARRQWEMGLLPRDLALRGVAASYDAPALSHVIEGMVRSLRFGTSLAEMLESSAADARSAYKAEIEERVARAPVKMLIPVGTLILPAMLIFVLGPILISLIEGM